MKRNRACLYMTCVWLLVCLLCPSAATADNWSPWHYLGFGREYAIHFAPPEDVRVIGTWKTPKGGIAASELLDDRENDKNTKFFFELLLFEDGQGHLDITASIPGTVGGTAASIHISYSAANGLLRLEGSPHGDKMIPICPVMGEFCVVCKSGGGHSYTVMDSVLEVSFQSPEGYLRSLRLVKDPLVPFKATVGAEGLEAYESFGFGERHVLSAGQPIQVVKFESSIYPDGSTDRTYYFRHDGMMFMLFGDPARFLDSLVGNADYYLQTADAQKPPSNRPQKVLLDVLHMTGFVTVSGEINYSANCGQTSTVMLEAYFKGIQPIKDRLYQVNESTGCKSSDDGTFKIGKSTKGEDLRKVLVNVMGFTKAQVYKGAKEAQFELLKDLLASGVPAIVHVNGRYDKNGENNYKNLGEGGHMILAIGYDDGERMFYFNDPGTQYGKGASLSYDIFLNTAWSSKYDYTIIAVPPDDLGKWITP